MFHVEQHIGSQGMINNQKTVEIRRICAKNGVILNDRMCEQLMHYVQRLEEWNAKINLISRRDVGNVWEAHILHSLAVVFEHRLRERNSILDLGSGGGLPGLPVKIVRPDLSLTMLDATRKKVEAVRSIVSSLGLDEAEVVWRRAEDPAVRKQLNKKFDVVIARAVAPLQDLAKWSKPFVRSSSHASEPSLIALKGGALDDEMRRVRSLGFVKEVRSKDLTFNGAEMVPGVEKKIVFVYFETEE